MAKKKEKFLNQNLTIEQLIEQLIEMQYICLERTDFKPTRSIENTIRNRPEKSFYVSIGKDTEIVYLWRPEDKILLEAHFTFDGTVDLDKTVLITGKILYTKDKAVELANKFFRK